MWLFGIPYEKPEIVNFKLRPKMSESGRIYIDKGDLECIFRRDDAQVRVDQLRRMRHLREKAAKLRSGK